MGTDNYEFDKSSLPQDIDGYSPYTDKQYNGFINDLNGGVYTNTSLSLVQFDLGQIYNSQKFTDTNSPHAQGNFLEQLNRALLSHSNTVEIRKG